MEICLITDVKKYQKYCSWAELLRDEILGLPEIIL